MQHITELLSLPTIINLMWYKTYKQSLCFPLWLTVNSYFHVVSLYVFCFCVLYSRSGWI